MTITDLGKPFTPKEVLLTPQQVSDWTGLSVPALAQLRYAGKGSRFLKPSSRHVLYRESDVQAWLDASERTITGTD